MTDMTLIENLKDMYVQFELDLTAAFKYNDWEMAANAASDLQTIIAVLKIIDKEGSKAEDDTMNSDAEEAKEDAQNDEGGDN